MELVLLAKEALQNGAERAASYRAGQSALRYMDRALWIVEKSARWAVPPPQRALGCAAAAYVVFCYEQLAQEAQNGAERAASYRAGQSALRYMDRALWIVEKSARWAVPPPRELPRGAVGAAVHGPRAVDRREERALGCAAAAYVVFCYEQLAQEAQNGAERAASYRAGQSALRYMDRALWIVEKSARWAVPPPLDQDERPQPELIRPLPWLLFFPLLILLRLSRESISLVNLALGKPPLRSADVVTYIQGKRRYLRTLKYQGNRMMRARTDPNRGVRESWYTHLQTLFEFTMCFRRQHYGNNNTQLINGDEVFIVKRKRSRPAANTVASTSETSMERLIEKMMVDVDVDSDESSSYTLTNITSGRSDRSDYNTESDQEAVDTKTQANQHKSLKQSHGETSPKKNNITTDKTIDSDQSNASMTRIRNNKQEIDSNTKEASLDFIQNEIGCHRSDLGYSDYKIPNGRMAGDLTATDR
ncbi:uncharacterized protein LOC112058013 [Bicyclus anynana]|uniref:Uncharacterized protein LOC112058013 n=1 Tax=Bicyclus anynana TaxID=110368 RepID=A0ABM3LXX8_BICAN|nr:uncharacterized protein LOC112058013 [Bicyclus anynana]